MRFSALFLYSQIFGSGVIRPQKGDSKGIFLWRIWLPHQKRSKEMYVVCSLKWLSQVIVEWGAVPQLPKELFSDQHLNMSRYLGLIDIWGEPLISSLEEKTNQQKQYLEETKSSQGEKKKSTNFSVLRDKRNRYVTV